jgi:hypothetical protein
MVIKIKPFSIFSRRACRGLLEIDMVVAIAIFAAAIMPVGYAFARERKVLKVEYYRSVALEIVDGEMEILAAGGTGNYHEGTQAFAVKSHAATVLPPGNFQLIKTGPHLRLEWIPAQKTGIGTIAREVTLK